MSFLVSYVIYTHVSSKLKKSTKMNIILQVLSDLPKEDVPKWTDIASAISAMIGVPLVVFTLYKLMKKDKERESEINSLSTIATKLTDMQTETEKRYKASKKPHIGIQLQKTPEGNRLKIDFTNSNTNVSITSFKLTNEIIDFTNLNYTSSTINDQNGKQTFYLILNGKTHPIEHIILRMDYKTEEGYTFIQNVIIWKENERYVHSPSVIIDKENSAI